MKEKQHSKVAMFKMGFPWVFKKMIESLMSCCQVTIKLPSRGQYETVAEYTKYKEKKGQL